MNYEWLFNTQAKVRKFLILTNERKKMSTKTTFKRIALVAVVALGLGGLSTVSANAAGNDAATATVALSNGSASTALTITGVVGGQVAFTVATSSTSVRYITSDAGGSFVSVVGTGNNNSTVAYTNGSTLAGGATWTPSADTDTVTVRATSDVAGSQVIKFKTIDSTTGVASTKTTVTISWIAAATAASTSTAFITTGTTSATANTTVPYASKSASGIVANVAVSLKDASANALVGQKLTVTVAGPGTICATPGAFTAGTTQVACQNSGIRAYADTNANSTSQWLLGLFADGTSGTTTITIAVGTTTIATKTFNFVDSPAKAVATQVYSIARAGSAGYTLGSSSTNTSATTAYVPAFVVYVTDKNGFPITGLTQSSTSGLSCSIGDKTVLSQCTIGEDSDATYASYGAGYYLVSVDSAAGGASGASTTVTVKVNKDASTVYASTDSLTYTLGGSIASTQVTLDSTTYAPGAPVVLTVSAKDSSGNSTYDGQAMAYALSASMPAGGSLPAETKKFAKGKYSTSATSPTLFAPATTGTWTISVTGNDAANTVVSASATIANAALDAATDAANEATDAANAATDAALAAADAADAATAAAQDASDAVAALSATVAKLVASLKAQITSLTNLVIKIQKKVKA
jgi:hypothetical protein